MHRYGFRSNQQCVLRRPQQTPGLYLSDTGVILIFSLDYFPREQLKGRRQPLTLLSASVFGLLWLLRVRLLVEFLKGVVFGEAAGGLWDLAAAAEDSTLTRVFVSPSGAKAGATTLRRVRQSRGRAAECVTMQGQ